MTTSNVPLHRLALDPRDEADLRWLLTREYEGELGSRSGFSSFERQLEMRACLSRPDPARWDVMHVQPTREGASRDQVDDEVILRAAARFRRIDRRWKTLRLLDGGSQLQDVLAALYGGRQYPGLDAFQSSLTGDLLGGVVLVSQATRDAHRDASSTHGLLDWLQHLSVRWLRQRHERKSTSSREQRRVDALLVPRLTDEAELLVVRAAAAFRETLPKRREVTRAA